MDYRPNELCHFGILGMKWGIRRYQNKDGTLTAAGKKRYAKELQAKEEAEKQKALEKEKRIATTKILKDFDKHDFFVSDDTTSKRAIAAADTGLKALARLGRSGFYGLEDLKSVDKDTLQDYREWFIWEDQTVGLSTISDLANQGKTKNEIRSLIDKAFDYSRKYGYIENPRSKSSEAIFFLSENGNIKDTEAGREYGKYVDDFIQACVDEQTIKHGQDFCSAYEAIVI